MHIENSKNYKISIDYFTRIYESFLYHQKLQMIMKEQKKPLKKSLIGFEVELLTINESGYIVNNADPILKRTKNWSVLVASPFKEFGLTAQR